MTFLRTLLHEAVDYAGLFPPASLTMDETVRRYAAYRGGAHAWMLGRLIVPVSRLSECASAVASLAPGRGDHQAWRLSVLPGEDLAGDCALIDAWNASEGTRTRFPLIIDTVEFKVRSAADISAAAALVRDGITGYGEIPTGNELLPQLGGLAAAGLRAKARTGGVVPEAFPRSADLARFICGCVRTGVSFKATAGLHHPVSGTYRLTYAADSAAGTMFGFLNVLLATVIAAAGADEPAVAGVLSTGDVHLLRMEDTDWRWENSVMHTDLAARARRLFIAFGSCSFDEPVAELQKMGFL
jgi:hypothetical protein